MPNIPPDEHGPMGSGIYDEVYGYDPETPYIFEFPFTPMPAALQEVEEFVYTQSEFASLTEEERRKNVVRLASNSAVDDNMGLLDEAEGAYRDQTIKLHGDVTVVVRSIRLAGQPTHRFTIVREES